MRLLASGGAAVTAVGIAAATGGMENRSPEAAVAVTPEGQAIVGITTMHFTATASDPDGDPLTSDWNLGDGSTASGETVSHRYMRRGTFRVVVTASDGNGGTDLTEASVDVGSLSGSRCRAEAPGRASPEDLPGSRALERRRP